MKPSRSAALVLSVGLLAGCGGGGEKSDAVAPDPAAASPGPSSAAPNRGGGAGSTATSTGEASTGGSPGGGARASASAAPKPSGVSAARAEALAKSGLLLAGDLPGYTGENLAFDGSENFGEVALYQCLRIPGPQYLSRNPGLTWTKGTAIVESTASVVAKAADLKKKVAASTGTSGAVCYGEGLFRLVEVDGASTGGQSGPAAVKVPKADGAFGVKFTVSATKDGQTRELTGYLVGAYVDTVEIFVVGASDGAGPKLADVVELANTAAARARAALESG
ncbi:MAG: hypothetical protein ACT4QF_01105 [Sporichthyaceae bacterium]